MQSLQRAFPGLPADRQGRIAYFKARISAREAADPLHWYKELYQWANPALVREVPTKISPDGIVIGLSTYHEWKRRCCVLRAWAAQKAGWKHQFRSALFDAGVHRRLAKAARKEGR